jgi:uncharacterized protein
MPVTPTYPGVYIEEVPSGVRTIVGVSTSVGAFLGYFHRGPIDTPIQVLSVGDFEREFGGLHPLDEAGYAIQQFFLNGGSTAWVVRVAAENGTPLTASAVTLQMDDGTDTLDVVAGRRFRGAIAEDPGSWGDAIRVEVDHDTRDPADTDLFNLSVSEVASRDGRRVVLRTEVYANLSIAAASPDYVIEKVNESSKLIQLAHAGGATAPPGRPAQTGTAGGPVDAGAALGSTSTFNVDAGSGPLAVLLDALTASTDFGTSPGTVRRAVERGIRAAGTAAGDPVLSGATVAVQGDRLRIVGGGGTLARFDPETRITFTENGQTTAADLGLLGGTASENVQEYVLGTTTNAGFQSNGVQGSDGTVPDAAALIGDFDDKQGIYALRDVDIFNLLVIPGAVAPHMSDDNAAAVYAAALAFCEEERSFVIVDVPEGIDEVQEVRDWVDDRNIRHRNAAVYFPRVHIPDPLHDGRLRSLGPSGTLAGIYARTDGARGVWKAPAGLEAVLRNVQGFATNLTDAENGQLNPVAINALRRFPIYGRVAWGARTLEGADVRASEWKYVPVRRFALFLEESLYRGLQWVVFEPNDEPLWSQIRLNVGAFMHDLFRKGAFQGTSPRDAYFVKCDAETTTQNDINQGIVNVVVGFAPLKPAEFVIIKIQQMAGQVQT